MKDLVSAVPVTWLGSKLGFSVTKFPRRLSFLAPKKHRDYLTVDPTREARSSSAGALTLDLNTYHGSLDLRVHPTAIHAEVNISVHRDEEQPPRLSVIDPILQLTRLASRLIKIVNTRLHQGTRPRSQQLSARRRDTASCGQRH